ncbi:MAG TPA: biotin-dependent carboxyltransferase family protein [Bacillales bacterium]|nr:biotin-dependent carboxyltransferase family protein [Bacillales bacterium]
MKIFEVIHSGIFTTVQDLGRKGYQKYGMAVSGSADYYAHRMANLLAGNEEDAAVLEVTLLGLRLKVKQSAVIAVTGGDLDPTINGEPMQMWTSVQVEEGDLIHFKGCRSGCRAYLAVAGGIEVPSFLGSKSTDTVGKIGGIDGRSLEKGDQIQWADPPQDARTGRRLPPSLIPDYPKNIDVRVILGPQDEAFTSEAIETFLTSEYKASKDLDRMACRLEGPEIKHKMGADVASEGIFLGAIQVPQNGQPIVFLVGRRSVGGYTKIGGVISVDLPKLAQAKPGDTIHFHQVELEEAHELLKDQEKTFKILKTTIRGG